MLYLNLIYLFLVSAATSECTNMDQVQQCANCLRTNLDPKYAKHSAFYAHCPIIRAVK